MTQNHYSQDYEIRTPRLHSETVRSLRVNPRLGDFTYDFSPLALEGQGLHAMSFCFFILWEEHLSGRLNTAQIWHKKEISIHGGGVINLKDRTCFDGKFFDEEPLEEVRRKQAFFSRYGLQDAYWIIRDLEDCPDPEPGQKVAIRVGYDAAADCLDKSPVSLEELQALLVESSNGPVCIKKPLNYYETKLEKYLQLTCCDTGALFPGDCDMLLYDDDLVCRYIIEFKKTTARDTTPIAKQSFLNYIKKDINKYTRLNILRNYFSEQEGTTVPFVTVFYSVREDQEDQIKLEVIDPDLRLARSACFTIGADPVSNQRLILEKIIELCAQP